MTGRDEKRPLVLSMGEPGGIGLEIAGMAWRRQAREKPFLTRSFLLLADPALVKARLARACLDIPVVTIEAVEDTPLAFAQGLPVLPLKGAGPLPDAPGEVRADTAAAVKAAIEQAVFLVLSGEAAGLVTLPIQKESLYAAGFDFEGHTDFLAHLARKAGFSAEPVMMLTAGGLRCVPVTVHIALSEVPRRLRSEAIVRQGSVLAHDLARFFGIVRPRIAVAGLNPHAGEGGRMGTEEKEIIEPAISALQETGVEAFGPLPADTLFHEEARKTYDAVLCMYHDQALIPVKTLDFHGGVNVTLGLPFVRTSPDHGTALALAGTGRARPDSLIAALTLAEEMAQTLERAGQ